MTEAAAVQSAFRVIFLGFVVKPMKVGSPDEGSVIEGAAALTQLLNEAGDGDPRVVAGLLPLVYEQLRRLAAQRMQLERPGQTLQPTDLVHEAFLRLVDQTSAQTWDGRWHFFAAAAEAMRRILIDRARSRSRLKHGGGYQRLSLDEIQLSAIDEPPDQLLELDEALNDLAEKYPERAQLVKLRFFAGLTIEQAARGMGISTATAERYWAYARAWLYRRMSGE